MARLSASKPGPGAGPGVIASVIAVRFSRRSSSRRACKSRRLHEPGWAPRGTILEIDALDLAGVESKVLATRITLELKTADEPGMRRDGSTNALIHRCRRMR